MRKYETILIMNPDLSEADLKTEISKIEGQLTSLSAQNIQSDRWGKKELGYRMKKRSVGNYVCTRFESDSSSLIGEITSLLRINDRVLKFQTHRINERVRKVRANQRSRGGDDGSFESDSVGF
jgi:small subunit ribosomal protein S6